jgi:hypothetical protein
MNFILNFIDLNILFDHKILIITSLSLISLYYKNISIKNNNIINELLNYNNKLSNENNKLYEINSNLFLNNVSKEENNNYLKINYNDLNNKYKELNSNYENELNKVMIDQPIQTEDILLNDIFNEWLYGKNTELTSLTNISSNYFKELKENDEYLINVEENVNNWLDKNYIYNRNVDSIIDSELDYLNKLRETLSTPNYLNIEGDNLLKDYLNFSIELDNWSNELIEIINNIIN